MSSKTATKQREEELDKKLSEIKIKEKEEQYQKLAAQSGLPFSTLKGVPIDLEAVNIISEEVARKVGAAVLYKTGSKVIVAISDPDNPETKEVLESLKRDNLKVEILLTTPEALSSVWEKYKIVKQKVFRVGAIDIDENEIIQLQEQISDISDLKTKLTSISVTKLLEILIAGAIKTRASDIHFEPELNDTRIRYRLDGILHDITDLENSYYTKVLNRVKILSKMKLNVHDSPQDGRFTIKQKSVDIEVRVSAIPSEFGETIALRLLDPRAIKSTLEDLGMRGDVLKVIKKQIKKNTGAIMVSGPTGAGKTTTLYAFVNHLNDPGNKIITIEDPIEYHVKDISQTQVDPRKGYTFANGLRSIVRQDPDIILVGEIRDVETAEIALHASLTGHLVLSTIHANDAAGVVPRLIDLGIRPQIIAPAINVTISQRLVRKLCSDCKKEFKADAEILSKLKPALDSLAGRYKLPVLDENLKLYKPDKCAKCNFSGYRDRIGVFEALVVSKDIEALILSSPPISAVQEMAVKEGMVTLLQDAYMKIVEGVTSIEEIERVI